MKGNEYGKANLVVVERMYQQSFVRLPRFILRMTELSASAKLVYQYLVGCVQEKGSGCCFPSLARIRRETGVAERTTRSCLQDLRSLGLIKWDGGSGRPHTFYLSEVPAPILSKYGDAEWRKKEKERKERPKSPDLRQRAAKSAGLTPANSAARIEEEVREEEDRREETDSETESGACAPPGAVPEDAHPEDQALACFREVLEPPQMPNEAEQVRTGDAQPAPTESASSPEPSGNLASMTAPAKSNGGSATYRVYEHFRAALADSEWFKTAKIPKLGAKEAGQIKTLLKRLDDDEALVCRMADCMVADWFAFREKYRCNDEVPSVGQLVWKAAELAAAVSTGNGITHGSHRVSHWAEAAAERGEIAGEAERLGYE